MTMLAEVVDAVIGIDTHRDSHEVEIADPAGKAIETLRIGNDSAGFAQLLDAIAKVAPGPRWRSASRAPVAMGSGWRGRWPLIPDRPATVTLQQACRARRDLVRHRVAVGNQLRAHLLCAFPAAAGLFCKLQAAGGPAGATLSN